ISLNKISKMFKADRSGLAKKLKEAGIDVVNRHNETKFDENIFDNINTEEKAYWLGFIYADGFISSNSNEFEISLKGSDIDHLQKFNQFMNHTDPNHVKLGTVVLKGKSFSRCRWGVTNKHLWNTLNSYGCVPNKSLVLKFPNLEIFSDPILINHFIRGYFDGDGCLIKVKRKSGIKPSSSLLGTFEFLSKVKEILELQGFDVSKLIFHPEKPKTYELDIHAKSRYSFLDYLYKGANIYLDRKFQLYQFFNSCRPKEESLGLSESKIGENCDVNPEVN
ncbi:MAG: LAGLIDADG family homing endonuclease, partial [Kurthia sp.]|nr:LAGLIDADG family homing endonuclease [Candidatus Kurthia equi]